MKEAATMAHPQPPSSTLVDGAMVLMLLLPSVDREKQTRRFIFSETLVEQRHVISCPKEQHKQKALGCMIFRKQFI